jgi:chromosome segregation ATPase
MSSAELKRRILRLLREDEEFRYAVLGMVGYGELLKRAEEHDRKFNEILARLEEHDKKFVEIIAKLEEHSKRFEEHDRKFNEILARLEEHDRKFEEIVARLEEHDRKFAEIMARLEEHDRKFEEIMARLEEHDRKFEMIMARLEEHDRKFAEIMARLEEHDRKFEEIMARLEEHDRKFEMIMARLEEHDRKFAEIMARLEEHDRKFEMIMARFEEHDKKIMATLEEHSRRFEEHDRKFNEITAILLEHGRRLDRHEEILAGLQSEMRRVHAGLESVSTTLQRLTISVEEEGASHIRYRLKEMFGVEVAIERIWVDGEELDFYGVAGDLCVVGEATVRLGPGLVDELLRKISDIRVKKPELLRPRLLKVIYADYASPDALDYARKNNVWILKWSGNLTPPSVEES